ncbi:PD40 domain-containing protein [Saccharicrinis fermentans]|uniref:PD40 domain-containing protein n=1 Tax=Saccharicrinis fermentans TaxID=982 RepID=UPI0004AFE40C|nr:PD40 domain-containing protein [Saccharicrinis fermentans]
MIKYLSTFLFWLLVVVMGNFSSVLAQESVYTPKKGLEYIKNEDFKNAQLVYAHLLKKYPKDAAYNYYMGICLLNNKGDLSQAVKMLNFAQIKRVSNKVSYYLGRAHQLSFRFEEAIHNYEKFLKSKSSDSEKNEKANYYLEQCRDSRRISTKIYELSVLDRSSVPREDILEMYSPAKDVGRFYKNGDFFESGVNPNHILFETERGDVVYFSMAQSSEDTMSIYKIQKLLDGWGDSEIVGEPVSSAYNDAYPFMASDGLTFYFASDRPGGFGGFDIYKVYYDNEMQGFLDPINMGVPFNSPEDDFLFVSDEFNEVAWFSSNRETTGDTVMVYKVKWDGSQVRNMVDDPIQIIESARLKLDSDQSDEYGNGRRSRTNKGERDESKKQGLFRFDINDTLQYVDFDNFLNPEALSLFKAGYMMDQQRDSLAFLMKSRRADFERVSNESDRNKIVNEILNLENRVYKLDDQIQEKYLLSRQKELNEIQDRIKQGNYEGLGGRSDESTTLNFDGVFVPEKYSFHISDEFERHYAKRADMYKSLFSENDIASLRYADSLYVWANILNLESACLLEHSTQVQDSEPMKLGNILKKEDSLGDDEVGKTAQMMKESKELKILSNRIYHKALDKKYPIYYLKLKDISRNLNDANSKNILVLSQQGNAYFREAKGILNGPEGLNFESYERAGTIKKAGVEKQEQALYLYSDTDNERVDEIKKEPRGVIQKSYSEIHRGEVSEKKDKEPALAPEVDVVPEKVVKATEEEVFKIQIGVFRNPPKQEALDKIPEVSKVELVGRGLTKYFSGSYDSYEEAQKVIPEIIDAGFTGAFVVYFKGGKQSSMPQK